MLCPMIAVLAVLFIGIFGMIKGSEFDKKYGNKLMQARVWLQFAALIMFALVLLVAKK
jgi:VIT1/CCC1 family predicted Fe2+/Mn2+ transporter